MAVAVDTSNSGGVTAAGLSASFSHTITTSSDTWLFILLAWQKLVGSVAVTVDGNAATLIDTATDTTNLMTVKAYAYQITSTGSKSVAVSWTTTARCSYAAISFTGVDGTTPTASAAHANNQSAGTCSVGVTTVSGDAAVLIGASNGGTTWTAQAGDVTIRNVVTGSAISHYSSYELATGTTTTLGATISGTPTYGVVSFAVKQLVAPTPVSDSDTGAATEGTPTLTGAYAQADTGAATEGTPGLTGSYAQSDTGTATEGTPTLAGAYAEADTGTGTEGVPTLTAGYAETDTGTATEGESVVIVLPPSVADVETVTLAIIPGPVATLALVAGPRATLAAVAGPTATLALVPGPSATLAALPQLSATLALVPGPTATLGE